MIDLRYEVSKLVGFVTLNFLNTTEQFKNVFTMSPDVDFFNFLFVVSFLTITTIFFYTLIKKFYTGKRFKSFRRFFYYLVRLPIIF